MGRDCYHTNLTVRNTLMRKQTGLDSDPAIFDNDAEVSIRFTQRMPKDWTSNGSSLGPVVIFDDYSWAPTFDISN